VATLIESDNACSAQPRRANVVNARPLVLQRGTTLLKSDGA
jgi:hypothetical protein